MIPRILHYVWVGPHPLPERHRRYIEQWAAFHPGYQIHHWGEADFPPDSEFLRVAMAHRCYANAANFLRWHALAIQGGVYLDTDVQILRPLDPLLAERCFVGYQEINSVNNAVIGAEPDHPFAREVLEELNRNGQPRALGVNGPAVLTRLLTGRGLPDDDGTVRRLGDVTVFPKEYFYPYSWVESPADATITPNTYTLHHWELSWTRRGSNDGIRPRSRPELHPNASFTQVVAALPSLLYAAARNRTRQFTDWSSSLLAGSPSRQVTGRAAERRSQEDRGGKVR